MQDKFDFVIYLGWKDDEEQTSITSKGIHNYSD